MKILVINEFVTGGGAEKIADIQSDILQQAGHEVFRLSFNYDAFSKNVTHVSQNQNIIRSIKATKLCFDPFFYLRIKKYLARIRPDIVISHNVFSSPITVYKALRGQRIINVIHDVYLLCPTALGIIRDGRNTICSMNPTCLCLKKCGTSIENRLKIRLKLFLIHRMGRTIKEVTKLIISPSRWLRDALQDNGYNAITINNPVGIKRTIDDKKKRNGTMLFCGGLVENKGIKLLMDALCRTERNISVDIYGSNKDDELLNKLKENNLISYKGKIEHDSLLDKMKEYDYLVMPSMCLENYPTVVLEAMASGTVVIGARVGGISEIIEDGRGFLFETGNANDLCKVVNEAYRTSDDIYEEIRHKAYLYVTSNNSIEEYGLRITRTLNSVTN